MIIIKTIVIIIHLYVHKVNLNVYIIPTKHVVGARQNIPNGSSLFDVKSQFNFFAKHEQIVYPKHCRS